jgi:hypothetical protein
MFVVQSLFFLRRCFDFSFLRPFLLLLLFSLLFLGVGTITPLLLPPSATAVLQCGGYLVVRFDGWSAGF